MGRCAGRQRTTPALPSPALAGGGSLRGLPTEPQAPRTRSSMPPMALRVRRSGVATTSMPLLFSSSAPQAVPSAGAGGRSRGRRGWKVRRQAGTRWLRHAGGPARCRACSPPYTLAPAPSPRAHPAPAPAQRARRRACCAWGCGIPGHGTTEHTGTRCAAQGPGGGRQQLEAEAKQADGCAAQAPRLAGQAGEHPSRHERPRQAPRAAPSRGSGESCAAPRRRCRLWGPPTCSAPGIAPE